jgi:5-methylcytosine-specific restriction endonuclease McrA
MFEYSPVPKPKSKPKDKPKPKDKRKHKEKQSKKNPYLYKGRLVPNRRERTKITEQDYKRMIEEFGAYCMVCSFTPIEAHHIVYRSHFGSGNWRNLAPLCKRCHLRAHKDKEFSNQLKNMRIERFGEHYWKDVYSLFKEGLVNNTTKEAYNSFMKKEEENAKDYRTSS